MVNTRGGVFRGWDDRGSVNGRALCRDDFANTGCTKHKSRSQGRSCENIASRRLEVMMRLDWLGRLVKSKSHPAVTAQAWREDCSRHCDNLMRMGVVVPVEFVMNHIVDTGGRYPISRLEFIAFFFHPFLLSECPPRAGSFIDSQH